MIINEAELSSDYEMFKIIHNGNKESFEIIYDQYCSVLYGLIIHSTQLEIYAEEILELVFLEIWNSFNSFNDDLTTFKNHIIKILIKVIIDYLNLKKINFILHYNKGLFEFELF